MNADTYPPPLTPIHPGELNTALGLHRCVYSLHAPDGRLLSAFATERLAVFGAQMRYWAPHLAAGCVAMQWNDGLPSVSYGATRRAGR